MLKPFTAADYRSLGNDEFKTRCNDIKELIDSGELPDGFTVEGLSAELDYIEAERNLRQRLEAERQDRASSVASGDGSVVATDNPEQNQGQEHREVPRNELPKHTFESRSREASDHYTDSIEYRRALSLAIRNSQRMPEDIMRKVFQERATQATDISGTPTYMDTFSNTDTTLVAVPYSVNQQVLTELESLPTLYNRINYTSEKGGVIQREADLHLDFTWLGSNDKIVSQYQGDEDPTSFAWGWNVLECRHSRSFLSEALLADEFKGLLGKKLADGYAKALDRVIVSGTGNMQPRGILTDPRLVGADGTGLGKTQVDGTFVPGTGVTLVDNKYVPGANAGTALFIEVSEDQVNDWKFWCSFLFDEQFNDAYVDSGELIIARNTWGSHIAVLHDDNNNPIGVSDPLHQETGRTIREVGPVNLVKGDTLPSFRQAEVGQVFGIYGNLQNYTMNIQPGWPMSVVTWDDHENNAHKTKLSVTMDGRVTDKWGWVFLVKGASA